MLAELAGSNGSSSNGSGLNGTGLADIQVAYPWWLVALLWLFAGCASLETILGNLLVLISYHVDSNLSSHPSNYFIASLAVSDLIIGVEGFPVFTLYVMYGERWVMGKLLCELWLTVDYMICLVSIIMVLLITVDRYYSVCHPTHYHRFQSKRKIRYMIILSWLLPASLFGTLILGWEAFTGDGVDVERSFKCYVPFLNNPYVNMSLYLFYYWTVLVAIIILYRGIHNVATDLERRSKAKHNQAFALLSTQRIMAQVGFGMFMARAAAAARHANSSSPDSARRLLLEKKRLLGSGEKSTAHFSLKFARRKPVESGYVTRCTSQSAIKPPLSSFNLASILRKPTCTTSPSIATDMAAAASLKLANSSSNISAATAAAATPSQRRTEAVVVAKSPSNKSVDTAAPLNGCRRQSLAITELPPEAVLPDEDSYYSHTSGVDSCYRDPSLTSIVKYGAMDSMLPNSLTNASGFLRDSSLTSFADSEVEGKYRQLLVDAGIGISYADCSMISISSFQNAILATAPAASAAKPTPKKRDSLTQLLSDDQDDDDVIFENTALFCNNVARHRDSADMTAATVACKPETVTRVAAVNSAKKHKAQLDERSSSTTRFTNLPSDSKERFGGSRTSSLIRKPIQLSDSERKIVHKQLFLSPNSPKLKRERSRTMIEFEDDEEVSDIDDDEMSRSKSTQQLSWLGYMTSGILPKGRRKSRAERKARKAFKIITVIVGAFALFWSPYYIVATVYGFCSHCIPSSLYIVSYFMCYLNSSVNPFCYALANQQFRRVFTRILRGDLRRR